MSVMDSVGTIRVKDKRGWDYGVYIPDKEYSIDGRAFKPDEIELHLVTKAYPHPDGSGTIITETKQIKSIEFI